MAGGWGRRLATGIAGLTGLGAAVHVAIAQEAPSGLVVTGSVTSRVEVDDNGALRTSSPGTDSTFETDLSLGISSETPTRLLTLSFGGTVVAEDLADRDDDSGFVDPFLSFDYRAEGADSRLVFDLDFTTRDIDDQVSTSFDGFTDDDLIVAGGELETLRAGVTLDLGIDGPLQGTLDYRINDRNYVDTNDPDLFDRTTETLRLTGRAALTPTATMRAFIAEETYDAEDDEQTERTTQSAGLGIRYEINPVLTLDGELSYQMVEEDRLLPGGEANTENDGVGLNASLTRDLPDGSLRIAALHEIEAQTSRSELTVGRDFELPGALLSFDIGVSSTEEGDAVLVGGFAYQRELPRGVISASAERSAVVNEENEERIRSFASIAYTHDLTPVSSVSLGLDFAQSELESAGSESSTTNTNLAITYNRQLTEDWDWQIGYRGRYREGSDGGSARSNALFTSIGRRFSIRP